MSNPSDYKRLMRGVIPYTVEGVDRAIEFRMGFQRTSDRKTTGRLSSGYNKRG